MISTAGIKFIQSLRLKKYRDKYQMFVAEGEKIVSELLSSQLRTETIYALQSWTDRYGRHIPAGVECRQINSNQLNRISLQKTPNQVLAVVNKPKHQITGEIFNDNPVLVLDALQDPGNLGTILRTADWFGIRHIICSEGTADVYNPKVIQASMGSFIRVKTYYTNPEKVISSLNGKVPVYGAFLEGSNLYKTDMLAPAVIIIGNESQGISPELAQYVTQKLTIPSYIEHGTLTQAESLNASVAAGIIMAHLRNRATSNPKTTS